MKNPHESTPLLGEAVVPVPADDKVTSTSLLMEVKGSMYRMYRHKSVAKRRSLILVYMGLTLVYFGIVTTLFLANNSDQDFIEENYFLPFHYLEFWSAFVFALVEAFLLVNTSDQTFTTCGEKVLLTVLGFNIVSSIVAAVLFSLDPEIFEVPSHLVEYTSQISVTLVDYIFIIRGSQGFLSSGKKMRDIVVGYPQVTLQMVFASLLLCMAIAKFLFYTEIFPTRVGPERSSHYVEFVGEMLNSLWAFFFATKYFIDLSKELELVSFQMKQEASV